MITADGRIFNFRYTVVKLSRVEKGLWLKGTGTITEPGLVDFAELWDACTPAERVAFLHQHAPQLYDFEVDEHSERQAHQLRRGVLIALAGLLEGSLNVEPEST